MASLREAAQKKGFTGALSVRQLASSQGLPEPIPLSALIAKLEYVPPTPPLHYEIQFRVSVVPHPGGTMSISAATFYFWGEGYPSAGTSVPGQVAFAGQGASATYDLATTPPTGLWLFTCIAKVKYDIALYGNGEVDLSVGPPNAGITAIGASMYPQFWIRFEQPTAGGPENGIYMDFG